MLSGFEASGVDVGETTIFIRRKGRGSPLLLLHGFPQTQLMWHRVAPALAEEFTVVCADLRGYGSSGKPPSGPDHGPYSKGVMALDMVRMMEAQGFSRFSVAGHDRWPWSLLAQPEPLPERLIMGDPEAVVDDALGEWGSERASFPPEVRAAYIDALRDPEAVHAICEEYRAAATIDFARDTENRGAGRRISCPTLALWSEEGALDSWYEEAGGPLGIWRDWAADVTGRPISGGHFFPEQNATETVSELRSFFTVR